MPDIGDLSTEELLRMRQGAPARGAPDLSSMSTEDLLKARGAAQAQAAPEDVTAGMALRGIPVLGAYIPQAEAAIRAAAQPLTGVGQPGATWRERYEANLPQREAQYAQAERESPITSEALKFGGGMTALAPIGATAAGARAMGITGPTLLGRLGAGAASGAALGGADVAARGGDYGTGALYGAAGGAGGALAGRALESLPRLMMTGGPARQAAVRTLEAEGVPLTAGQRTGFMPMRWSEAALGDVTGAGSRAIERGKEAFTGALLRRAGLGANRATSEVLDNALENFDTAYRSLAARNSIEGNSAVGNRIMRSLGTDMTNTVNDYAGMVGRQGPTAPGDYMDRIVNAIAENNGNIPGEVYHTIRSELGRDARKALRGGAPGQQNYHLADALYGLQDNLDEAMRRSMVAQRSPDMPAWQQLNRWYKNFLPIERAATATGEQAALGLISPAQMRTALTSMQGRRAYGRGAGDLAELTRAANATMLPMPQSGTAARHFMMTTLPAAAIGLPVGVGTGNLPLAASSLLHLVGTPTAGAALMSRPVQRYLGGQPTSLPAWLTTLGITGAEQMAPYQRR